MGRNLPRRDLPFFAKMGQDLLSRVMHFIAKVGRDLPCDSIQYHPSIGGQVYQRMRRGADAAIEASATYVANRLDSLRPNDQPCAQPVYGGLAPLPTLSLMNKLIEAGHGYTTTYINMGCRCSYCIV